MKETKDWLQEEVIPRGKKAKKRGWGETMFLEPSLQRKTSDTSRQKIPLMRQVQLVLLWLDSPSQLMDSSLYRNWIQQLESFFYYCHCHAIPADDCTRGATDWTFATTDIFIVRQLRCHVCMRGFSFDILKINLQKGKLSVQTRGAHAAVTGESLKVRKQIEKWGTQSRNQLFDFWLCLFFNKLIKSTLLKVLNRSELPNILCWHHHFSCHGGHC